MHELHPDRRQQQDVDRAGEELDEDRQVEQVGEALGFGPGFGTETPIVP